MLIFYFIIPLLTLQLDKSCSWKDNTGYIYDLSLLHKQLNYQVSDTDTSMGMFNMVYEFNFCSGAVRCQGREVAAFEALEVMGKITENCDVLGLKETQHFEYLNPSFPEQGISITYSQGDMCFDVGDDNRLQKIITENEQMQMTPRSVTFQITCGQDQDNFNVIDSSKCNIQIGITHSLGCRNGKFANNSNSFNYLLYIIIIGVLYFGIGLIYNKKTKGLQGNEALPNAEFWKDFPHLVRDGINFTAIKLISLVKGTKFTQDRGYSTI